MASDRVAAVIRAAFLPVAGAAAAAAWMQGLYASAFLATLVAVWIVALAIVTATPLFMPVSAPAPIEPSPIEPSGAIERQRLTAYLDFSPAPLIALDDAGRLHAINRAARRLFASEDLVVDPPPSLVSALADTASGRTATVELRDDTDARSFALATGDLSFGATRTRIGALINIDAELKAAEATALRELVQVLSHEVVNALTPIASLAQSAADMLGDPDPALSHVRDAVETVARRAAGLHRFGEAYRALARLPAPTIERIAVPPFVADLERLFVTRWPAIPLVIDAVRAPPYMRGDPDQLSAATWALLQNAAEAVATLSAPKVDLSIEAIDEGFAIEVADNGLGIPAADADAVFRPFFTTKPEGTGVGLALARQIFRGHTGELLIKSRTTDDTRLRGVVRDSGR